MGNPTWCEAQAHERWIAVEAASCFQRKLRVGAARDAPYVVVTGEQKKPTKYADVYVRYQPGAEKEEPWHLWHHQPRRRWVLAREDAEKAEPWHLWHPWHLFFEFKCVSKSALSWKATLGAFTKDVGKKLTSLDVAETNSLWCAGEDAWCRNLGLTEGRVIGIGVLFVALVDDGRLERLKQIRKDNRGSIVSILDQELPPDDDDVVTLCLAYGSTWRRTLQPGSLSSLHKTPWRPGARRAVGRASGSCCCTCCGGVSARRWTPRSERASRRHHPGDRDLGGAFADGRRLAEVIAD